MNNYEEEIENIANSIEIKLRRQYIILNLLIIFFIFFIAIFFYVRLVIYSNNQIIPLPISLIFFILLILPLMSLTSMNQERVFKNMREKIFFYLFYSWKNHNDEEKSKKYLKNCIDELDVYIENYKKLEYTEEISKTFDAIRDLLIYHIYPKLGVREPFQTQGDLISRTSAWDGFKMLSIDIYYNSPIQSLNEKVSILKTFFKRDENIKFADENQLTKTVKTFVRWNVGMYNSSLSYRFFFFLLLTAILDYLLISYNLVKSDVVLSATILIPIMAPYYLALKH